MSIYKITEVTICMSLHEHPDVTFAEHTPCLEPCRKLISIAILLKFSQTHVHSENRKIFILIKNTLRALLRDLDHMFFFL